MKLINDARKTIGQRLFEIALKWSVNPNARTKKAMREEVKSCKGRKKTINGSESVEAAFKATLDTAEAIYDARKIKQTSNLNTNKCFFSKKSKTAKYGVWQRDLETRLKSYKKLKLNNAFQETLNQFEANYRYDVAPQVAVVTDFESVFYSEESKHKMRSGELVFSQSESLDWDYYSKSCKYPKKLVQNKLCFSKHYIENVVSKKLDFLDGMLTLSAIKLECEADCDLYDAKWLTQSRGYSINVKDGFIAVKDGVSFHGKTAKSAIAGLSRKINNLTLSDVFNQGLDSPRLKQIINKFGDLEITKKDATLAGACVSGTRSWCYKVGIDYDNRESCTVDEVYNAWKLSPRSEIKSVLIKALTRQSVKI